MPLPGSPRAPRRRGHRREFLAAGLASVPVHGGDHYRPPAGDHSEVGDQPGVQHRVQKVPVNPPQVAEPAVPLSLRPRGVRSSHLMSVTGNLSHRWHESRHRRWRHDDQDSKSRDRQRQRRIDGGSGGRSFWARTRTAIAATRPPSRPPGHLAWQRNGKPAPHPPGFRLRDGASVPSQEACPPLRRSPSSLPVLTS